MLISEDHIIELHEAGLFFFAKAAVDIHNRKYFTVTVIEFMNDETCLKSKKTL